MSLIVTGKGDFTLLPQFQKDDFSSYELYLGLLDESIYEKARQLPAHIHITSIHTPTWIEVSSKPYPFDLGQVDPIGSIAVKALQQTIQLGEKLGAQVIVVHGASFNSFLEKKEPAMQRLAERVRPLINGTPLKLCFETDVLWHNLYYSRRALLTTTEDFQLLHSLLPNLKITADIEHLSITFHFQQFLKQCGGELPFLRKYSEVAQKKFEAECQQFIKDNYDQLQLQFKGYLSTFFGTFHNEIEHVHINGSDCCNYLFHPQTSLPFIGEHLPLGLRETEVSDKIDYPFVAALFLALPLEKEIHLVMEVWRTNPAEFITACTRSKSFLEQQLASSNSAAGITKPGGMPMGGNTMEKNIYIRDREMKNFGKPFIIAEIGMNHNGDVELAKKMIDAAHQSGADCAKFQSWSKSSLFSRQIYENNPQLEKDIDLYSFGKHDAKEIYRQLKAHCDSKGIIFATSVFNEAEADFFVDELNMGFIKIASMDVTNLPFLEYLAKKGKTLVLSTGLSTLAEIAEAVQTITQYNKKLVILHCLSVYPDAQQGLGSSVGGQMDAGVNLNNIEMLHTTFGFPVGFSDNAPGIYAPLAAVAKGACVIEKHFTLDKNMVGWDHAISADPADLKTIVEGAHTIQAALGSSSRVLSSKEQKMRRVFRRSIVAARSLPAGHILRREDIDFKRPGTGLEPKQWELVVGRELRQALSQDGLVQFEDLV